MNIKIVIVACLTVLITGAIAVIGQKAGYSVRKAPAAVNTESQSNEVFDGRKIVRTEAAWKKVLSPDAFYVLRKKGTERAYTGALTDNKKPGTYACAACGLHLFSSDHKFDSETGWPSFFQVIHRENIEEEIDTSLGESRTEILCKRCDSHLGHVFDDGPQPTGLRYCINSVALKFLPRK